MKLVEFDGVPLPLFNAAQMVGVAPVETTLISSVGGSFDHYGTRTRTARQYRLSAEGEFLGEVMYLVDEAGNRLVDEAGNALVAGTAATHLRGQVQALRAKVGVRGTLWRQRLDDTATQEWITARCLDVTWDREVNERTTGARVTAVFESAMVAWRAATATATAVSATASVLRSLTLANSGDATVTDAVLTVACTSGTITAFALACVGLGIDWTWSGSLASGSTLTVDAGAKTVRVGTTDSYSGMTFAATHTARGWLTLPTGMHGATVLCTGGAATVTVMHYNQWR